MTTTATAPSDHHGGHRSHRAATEAPAGTEAPADTTETTAAEGTTDGTDGDERRPATPR